MLFIQIQSDVIRAWTISHNLEIYILSIFFINLPNFSAVVLNLVWSTEPNQFVCTFTETIISENYLFITNKFNT